VAFSQVMKDERKGCAVAHYASLGVTVGRAMTDNGSCYKPSPSASAFADCSSEI
jgi:hypothetical protein